MRASCELKLQSQGCPPTWCTLFSLRARRPFRVAPPSPSRERLRLPSAEPRPLLYPACAAAVCWYWPASASGDMKGGAPRNGIGRAPPLCCSAFCR